MDNKQQKSFVQRILRIMLYCISLFFYEILLLINLVLDVPFFIGCMLIPLSLYALYEYSGSPLPCGMNKNDCRIGVFIGSIVFGLFFGAWAQFQLGQMKIFPDYLTNKFRKNEIQTNIQKMNNKQQKNLFQSKGIFGMILYCASLFFYTILWLIGLVIAKFFIVFCIAIVLYACILYESWGLPLPEGVTQECFLGYAIIGSVVFGIIFSIIIKNSLMRFVADRFEHWKHSLENNVYNHYEKYETEISASGFDFDINEILDTPDVKDVKGWDTANEVLFLYYRQFKDQLEELTEPQKIFYLVNEFYSEMIPSRLNTGGFQTFFEQLRNKNDAYNTLTALQKIGAEKTFELLQECINTNDFNTGNIKTVFNKCTKKYLAGIYKTENIRDLCLEYVRQNKEHFRYND
jgi:hypothetical protein